MSVRQQAAAGSPLGLRAVLAVGLIVVGLALALFGPVRPPGHWPVARAACSGQNLYLGSYYLLPEDSSHPDFEQALQQLQDVPGQLQAALVGGLPVPTAPNPPAGPTGQPTNTSIRQFDWYTPRYQSFTRLDSNPISYSNDNTAGTVPYFGPGTAPATSAALPPSQDLFAVHWHANLFAPPGGLFIPYSFALDDAGWVFLDGQLRIDHGGIHPPATFTGTFVIPEGPHVIDIFFADRHTVNAVTNFQLGNLGALLDCGSPNLSLVKSVQPNAIVRPGDLITYTVNVTNSGNYTATNTIIRDAMPASTSFVAASPSPVTAPPPGGNGEVVWNLGTLLPGQSRTLNLVVRVNSNTPPALAISNAALGSSDESGGVVFKSNGVSNLVDAASNLRVTKTATPPPGSPVSIGDTVTYLITVANSGNVSTGSVTVEDPLPAGSVFVSASPAPLSVQNGRARWVLSPLPPDSQTTISLTVRVINRAPSGLLQNQAVASSGPGVASPLVTHSVREAADTSLDKLVAGFDLPLAPGSLITYTLQGANAGPSVATNVVISDTLPPGLNFVSSTWPTTTVSGSLVTINLGNLNPGQVQPVTLVAQVAPGYTGPLQFSNRATIRSDTPELVPANNTAVADVPGNNAPVDATVIKSGPPEIAPNQVFIYRLLVSSELGGDNIVVTDTLPAGLTLVPEQTSPPALGGPTTLYWNLGRLEPGDTREILLAVRASGVTPGTTLNNTARISGGRGPVRTTPISGTASTRVANATNLSISKAAQSTTFEPGQPLTFVINVTNNAATPSGSATISDTLQPGLVPLRATPAWDSLRQNPDGTYTVAWLIGSVPGNARLSFTLTVQVPPGFTPSTISNQALLQTDSPNSDPNLFSGPVDVPRFGQFASLNLSKDSVVTTLARGQAFAYTIVVSNTGPVAARDVVVRDTLPPGLIPLSAQPAPTGFNAATWRPGDTLSWTFPDLPANGGQQSITLIVQLDRNFQGSAVSNRVEATTVSGNTNQGNTAAVKTLPIQAPPARATPAVTPRPAATPTPTTLAAGGSSQTISAASPVATVDVTASRTVDAGVTPAASTPIVTTGATVTTGPATTTTTTAPGLPNAGKMTEAATVGDWLVWLGQLGLGLGLIALGVRWLLRPGPARSGRK